MARLLTCEYQAGEEIPAGETTLTPFSKAWRLHVPGANINATWNRPASVLVRTPAGQEQVLAIPDLTRRIIWSLLGACLGAVVLAGIISILNRRT